MKKFFTLLFLVVFVLVSCLFGCSKSASYYKEKMEESDYYVVEANEYTLSEIKKYQGFEKVSWIVVGVYIFAHDVDISRLNNYEQIDEGLEVAFDDEGGIGVIKFETEKDARIFCLSVLDGIDASVKRDKEIVIIGPKTINEIFD